MKNLKNMFTAVILVAVLMIGTASANAGLLLSDRANSVNAECEEGETIFEAIEDLVTGIILLGVASESPEDETQPACTEQTKAGLLLSD